MKCQLKLKAIKEMNENKKILRDFSLFFSLLHFNLYNYIIDHLHSHHSINFSSHLHR